jgi:Ca-activated chloride channel family protein
VIPASLLFSLVQVALPAEPAVRSAADERFKLWGAYSLADPWFLLLIPVGLLALAWGRSRRGRERGRVPALVARTPIRSLAQNLAWLPTALSAAAIVFVSIALARPLRGSVETSSQTEGVDIALLIDQSGSMRFEDLEEGQSRIDVVKSVVHDFAVRRMTDREGAADNVALIVFAAYPRLLCPFTLDVDAITGFLKDLKPVENRAEDGTAIGVGVAKAVAVLRESNSKTKIVVLLTDGENNIDLITPLAAADLAAQEKVKVYTVFAGRYEFGYDMFGNLQRSKREIDTSDLEKIAEKTGGRFYRARDRKDLERIYAEIEKLERTKRVEKRWSETYDLYLVWLAPGLLLHVLAWLLGSTFLRRLP